MINANKKLIIFDIDGVLLRNKSSFKEILGLLGKETESEEIDKEYQKRKSSGPWGLEELVKLYQGFSKEELKKVALDYCENNIREESKQAIAQLKEKGYLVGVISSNPQFAGDALAEILSLDFAEGTEFEFENNVATGLIKRKIDRNIKPEILKEKINELGVQKQDVIVVGNSVTTVPMSEIAEMFIAFLPKDDIAEEKAVKTVESFEQLIESL